MNKGLINSREDSALSALLMKWDAPEASSELDKHVLTSFRITRYEKEVLPDRARKAQASIQNREVTTMKECPNCKETYSTMFVFCPIDSTLLIDETEPQFDFEINENDSLVIIASGAYNVTMMNDAGLVSRLVKEIKSTAKQVREALPELRRDPVGFTKETLSNQSQRFFRFITSPNVAVALVVALMFMLTTVAGIAMLDRLRSNRLAKEDDGGLVLQSIIDIPQSEEETEKGSAGNAKGNGGGSGEKGKPHGGGGGGDTKPASQGKPPQASLEVPQIIPPMVDPPRVKNSSLPVPTTVVADPMLFPPDLNAKVGDPNSKSTDPSMGPGKNGGIGPGDGPGVGPGRDGNTGGDNRNDGCCGPGGDNKQSNDLDISRPFRVDEVQRRAQITFNPQPQYTEDARKNQVQGVVRISMVLTASGQLQNFRTVSGLPFGLTEKALEAARRIKFVPAQINGRNVSQYVTVEYNFRIY